MLIELLIRKASVREGFPVNTDIHIDLQYPFSYLEKKIAPVGLEAFSLVRRPLISLINNMLITCMLINSCLLLNLRSGLNLFLFLFYFFPAYFSLFSPHLLPRKNKNA